MLALLIEIGDRRRIGIVITLKTNARVQDDGRPDDIVHVDANRIAADDLVASCGDGIRQAVSSVVLVCGRQSVIAGKMDVAGKGVVDLDAGNPLKLIGGENKWIVIYCLAIDGIRNVVEDFGGDRIKAANGNLVVGKGIADDLPIYGPGG